MKKTGFLLIIIVLATLVIHRTAAQNKEAFNLIIPVKGTIDLGLSSFIDRTITENEGKDVKAYIFEINTFGGRVDAAFQIIDSIDRIKDTPTIAYVKKEAWSAGALIALGCKTIIMAPGSSIGSAEPRQGTMGDQKTDEKHVSALRSKFRAVAEKNGHAQDIAEAMVDADIEIRKISDKGKLLNLTAKEAVGLRLAKTIIPTREELLKYFKIEKYPTVTAKSTWSEILVRGITHPIISSLLLSLGFIGLLIEFRMPGWGITGTLSIIALSLFFGGHYLVGLANWGDIVLFIIGLILIGLEIFVIPGFGIAGIAGTILLLASMFFAMLRHPMPEFPLTTKDFLNAFYTISFAIIFSFISTIVVLKYFPKSAFWNRFVLHNDGAAKEGYTSASIKAQELLGKTGKTISILRPYGRAVFDNEILDVTAEGDFIEAEKNVRIIKVAGNKIFVEKVSNG